MNDSSQITTVSLGQRVFRKIEPYLYLVPAFVFIAAFTYYPFLKTMTQSFFRLNRYREIREFIGLENYLRVLGDEKFIQAIGNTLVYVVATVPISIVLGFGLALLARKRTKSSRAYEAMYALSMAISASVIAMIFQLAFNPSMGIVNKIFGLEIAWLTNPKTALLTIVMIQVWSNIGYNFIFLLAALRGMNDEVLQGAMIDGATGAKLLSRIVIPMVSPTLLFLLVKDIAYAMTTSSFTIILTYPAFHSGGPQGTTETIMSYVYGKGIIGTNYNAAFAATMIGFVLSAAMMVLSLILEKKKVNYD